jgi:HlyD family secretion protein
MNITMKITKPHVQKSIVAIACIAAMGVVFNFAARAADEKKAVAPKPALTVNVTQALSANMPLRLSANGNIAPWQEASIGTEANGLRLADVRVNVGDSVKRGQVLATFAPESIQADVAQIRASVAEAEANLSEAAANAQRARDLQTTGALSASQINQYLTAERTAQARLQAQRAAAQVQGLRLKQTQVLAPDNGIISARSATVGAVLPAGQELFRMIRQGRLEWRAEVAGADLSRLKPGMEVRLNVNAANTTSPPIVGKVRMVAPTVDPQTRNGVVYVDLTSPGDARSGMFARGDFAIGEGVGLTLPQTAVQLRDGFNYVLRVAADSKVSEVKVTLGRRVGNRIEITGGLDAAARVVTSGAGFLADGDTVRVVEATPTATPTAAATTPAAAAAATATVTK